MRRERVEGWWGEERERGWRERRGGKIEREEGEGEEVEHGVEEDNQDWLGALM